MYRYIMLNLCFSVVLQQYSAMLIQYKFGFGFGGFKIKKVEEELKRGRFLVREL